MRPFLTLHDPLIAETYYKQGVWTRDTFYSLLESKADKAPDGRALRDGYEALTWKQLKKRVDLFASELRRQGLVPGDRVSVWMSNKAAVVITFLACSREGYACNPSLHKTYTCHEIIELLRRLNTRVLITEEKWGADREDQNFNEMAAELPSLLKVYNDTDLPQQGEENISIPWSNPDSIAYLAFTSGTTGAPKCVMHSSNTLLSNARDMVADWDIHNNSVMLSLSPLSHHIAWVGIGQWLVSGCEFVVDASGVNKSRLDWILEVEASYVLGVPTHAMDILQEQTERKLPRIGNVEIFYMAGAPIPDIVAEAFIKLGIKPQNVYGMTENSSHQYTHPNDAQDVWIATCGRGGNGYEVAIFDADDPDKLVERGVVGQIAGRGANLMLGYYGNQSATEQSFNKAGWFLSGDLGELDEQGNLKIKGRLKDLIIRGGHNIHPSHIEALALRSDNIELAAAFAVPDDRLGEKVCLAIKGSLTADETLQFLAQAGLSKFYMPEFFIALEDFPLTPSGKILKRELERQVAESILQPEAVRYQQIGS